MLLSMFALSILFCKIQPEHITCLLRDTCKFDTCKKFNQATPLVTNLHALAVFKMAAPVVRICRRCICSQAKKTHVKRANPNIDRIVRVDHAGELGADRIYAGQMAILGRTSVGPTIQVRNLRYVRFCRVFSSFLYFFSLFPFRFLHSYSFLVDQDQGNPT